MSTNLSRGELKETLQEMDDYDFEKFVADLWRLEGWETSVSQQRGDEGIDVIAKKVGPVNQKMLIQAKRYQEGNKVTPRDIREYNSLTDQERDADAVAVVTSSDFTKGARNKGYELNVKLVDGDDIVDMIEKHDAEGILADHALEGETRRRADPEAPAPSEERDRGGVQVRGLNWYVVTYEQVYIVALAIAVAGAAGLAEWFNSETSATIVVWLFIGFLLVTPYLIYRDTKLARKNNDRYTPTSAWPLIVLFTFGFGSLYYVYRRLQKG